MASSHSWWPITGLLLATILVYLPAFELGWIWDDDHYVTANPLLRSTDGLWRIWFQPHESPQYYPVVFSVLWSVYQLFGLQPVAFHALNVGLHALNAVWCYKILKHLQLQAAFWIALAFSLHPIQVESVAWVTELKNLLSAFFFGLAWLVLWPAIDSLLLPAPEQPKTGRWPSTASPLRWSGRYLCATVLFLMALLSKSVTASLPAGMLLAVWFRRGRLPSRVVCLLFPWFVLGAVFGWQTASLERAHVGAVGGDWDYSLSDRVGIAARCIWHYTYQAAIPVEQVFFYPRFEPRLSPSSPAWASILGCLVVLTVVVVLAVRGKRGPLACAAFFVGTAFPALGFLNVYPHRFSFVADHFVYIPVVGLLCFLGTGLWKGFAWLHSKLPRDWKRLSWLLMALWFGGYAMAVNAYLPVFANSIRLWEDTLRKNAACPAALQNLGLEYLADGRLEEAEHVLRQAAHYNFDRYQTWNSLGLVLAQQGKTQAAREAFLESARLNVDYARPWINLANLTRRHPSDPPDPEAWRRGAEYYHRAWEVQPEHLSAFGLGVVYYEQGEYLQALTWFRNAAAQAPGDLDSQFNVAQCLFELKRYQEALAVAGQLQRDFPEDEASRQLYDRLRKTLEGTATPD